MASQAVRLARKLFTPHATEFDLAGARMADQAPGGSPVSQDAEPPVATRPGPPADAAADAEVARLAAEVLRYLRRHPGAADTIEGIAEWWLAKQRLEDTLVHVQAAVDRLVTQDLVEANGVAGGRVRYRLRPGQSEEPTAPPPDTDPAGLGSDAAYFRLQGKNPDGSDNPAHEVLLDVDNLIVAEAWVGKNLVMKRGRPRARGRFGKIMKPFSEITIKGRQAGETA